MENDIEKYIITKEIIKEHFDGNLIIVKNEYIEYLKTNNYL